jgi:acyl-CoA synthetase (NDP forming)
VESVAVLLGADKVQSVLEQAAEIGAEAAWVLASGFGEAGAEGRAREAELVRFSEQSGLMVCGPNCIGVANLVNGVATYSVALSPRTRPGHVSAVVQSGAICLGLANAARFGLRYLISSGNEAVLDSADYIGYLAHDSRTRVILAFLEGIRCPEKFVVAAETAAQNEKPILVVKVGRSATARRTVQAHTGSLAGSGRVVDAVFRQLGVMRLDTLDELVEAAELFATCPLPTGNGVGLLSLSGGQIGLIADLAEGLDLDFPTFSADAKAALEQILAPFSPIANPLDAWGSGDLEATYPACVDVVSQEEDIHLLAVSRDSPMDVAEREVEQSLSVAEAAAQAARRTGKPVLLFSNLCAGFDSRVKRVLDEGGVPYLQGTRETLRAIQAFVDYGEFQWQRSEAVATGCPSPPTLARWRERLQEGALSEVESRRLLADYGIWGPEERVAASADEAVDAALTIGYPVVLKILSPDIPHKTETRAVRVGLGDDRAVRLAFQEVMAIAQERHPGADLQGVLIQEMVGDDAVEVIVGLLQDADFGPVVVFGLGGILVELLTDSSLRLPPLSRRDAREMIEETRASRLLAGFRGKPAADVEALVTALVRVSQLAVDLRGQIAALDINPLMVLPEGKGVRAVDALVDVASSGPP